jgi:hypothetical protein
LNNSFDRLIHFYPRGDCTVELAGRHIIKAYDCPESTERVEKLVDTYKLLQTKAVPNTDHLEDASENRIMLLPRGVDNMPKSEQELVDAIVCILEALVVSLKVHAFCCEET